MFNIRNTIAPELDENHGLNHALFYWQIYRPQTSATITTAAGRRLRYLNAQKPGLHEAPAFFRTTGVKPYLRNRL